MTTATEQINHVDTNPWLPVTEDIQQQLMQVVLETEAWGVLQPSAQPDENSHSSTEGPMQGLSLQI